MAKNKNIIYLIVGALIVGLILYNNNPRLFSVSGNANSLSYTNVRDLTGITVGGCWNEKAVKSIDNKGKGIYKIGWVWGCNCYKISSPKGNADVTLYFTSDIIKYRDLKVYADYVIRTLKSTDPYKNYNYAAIYQTEDSWIACDQTKPDANHIVISVTNLDSKVAGQSGIGHIFMSHEYMRKPGTLIHEFSHNYGLQHVASATGFLGYKRNPHKEFKDNYMIPVVGVSKGKFLQFQKDIIIATITNKLRRCSEVKDKESICYPSSNGVLNLLELSEYPNPTPTKCPCSTTIQFKWYNK